MTADPARVSAFDLSLLRFLHARVPANSALNDDASAQAPQLPPEALAAELLTLQMRSLASVRDPSTGPDHTPVLPQNWGEAGRGERGPTLSQRLGSLLGQLHLLDLGQLGSRERRTAFWLNCYSALVLDAVRRFAIRGSVREVPGFYRLAAYWIGGERFSAEEIEHGILRGNRAPHPRLHAPFAAGDPRLRHSLAGDPRLHCALNCATRSCPPLRVYTATGLDDQLDAAAAAFLNAGAVAWDDTGFALLSPIFDYYTADFGTPAALACFLRRYLNPSMPVDAICAAVEAGRVRYRIYDWSLPEERGDDGS
jgi:hypothetical protein